MDACGIRTEMYKYHAEIVGVDYIYIEHHGVLKKSSCIQHCHQFHMSMHSTINLDLEIGVQLTNVRCKPGLLQALLPLCTKGVPRSKCVRI